jgi:hypothetical protein
MRAVSFRKVAVLTQIRFHRHSSYCRTLRQFSVGLPQVSGVDSHPAPHRHVDTMSRQGPSLQEQSLTSSRTGDLQPLPRAGGGIVSPLCQPRTCYRSRCRPLRPSGLPARSSPAGPAPMLADNPSRISLDSGKPPEGPPQRLNLCAGS